MHKVKPYLLYGNSPFFINSLFCFVPCLWIWCLPWKNIFEYFSELKILVKKIFYGDNLHFQTVSFHKQLVGNLQHSDHVNSLGKDDLIAWKLLADPQAFCGSRVGENPSLLNISFLVLAVIYSRHWTWLAPSEKGRIVSFTCIF